MARRIAISDDPTISDAATIGDDVILSDDHIRGQSPPPLVSQRR